MCGDAQLLHGSAAGRQLQDATAQLLLAAMLEPSLGCAEQAPSALASAALLRARRWLGLAPSWPPLLAQLSGYAEASLLPLCSTLEQTEGFSRTGGTAAAAPC